MNVLYEQSIFSDEFIIKWQTNEIKSDKKCVLYDRKVEKAFRPLLEEFVQWLQSAEYGAEEDGYGQEEEKEAEVKAEEPEETEAQKQQRLLIEKQKKA